MSIFGNGVVQGWNVTTEGSFSVRISQGYGNINYRAARTSFPETIDNIPPNSITYIYARGNTRTTFEEDVDFVISSSRTTTDPNFLLLAQVTAGTNSIEAIDESVRQEITFRELIKAAVKTHKHRGGSSNPSKIDLASEVKGQLPSFRIADFDAEKVTTGTFELSRMPLLDHQDLQNVGLLSHPQLDTFVKTLQASNKEIFGEILSANFLQLVLAAKFIYDDPDSAQYLADRTVDQYMHNEIAVIPGITPDTLIDFDNSTADINLIEHYIAGLLPTTGTTFYVTYNTSLAWQSAYVFENLLIVGDTVTLSFNDADETNILTIEGFESATANDQILDDDGGTGLFNKEIETLDDDAHLRSDSTSTNVIEGFFSGSFTHQQSFRSLYVKQFDESQDWSTYDAFVLHVKCLDQIHGSVKLYFTSSSGDQSAEYVLLAQDEVTQNQDPGSNNFEVRTIDLTAISFSDSIASMTIYTDDLVNPFNFWVDNINIQRATLLPEDGQMIIRYSASSQVTFKQIEFDTTEPAGTDITVRARAASGTALLARAEWTSFLTSGNIINLVGSDLEIEVTFTPDINRLSAPTLNWLRVLITSQSEIDGFNINTSTEFARGESENINITSLGTLTLDSPVYVGSYYNCLGNAVNQISENTAGDTPFVESELAIFGHNAPIAPNQVLKAAEENQGTVSLAKLFEPRSVRRQGDRSFLVADTYNDRIVEFGEDGSLVSGIGSVNYEASGTFPIAASVDVRTGILYVVWSKRIQFRTVNVSKLTLQTATQKIQLITNFDKILGLTSSELETITAEGQIMPVHLSQQNAGLAELLDSDGSNPYLLVSNDAVTSGIDSDDSVYQRIATALGIPLFIGNFAYIEGIFSPTWVEKADDDSLLICNATVAVKDFDVEGVTRNTNASSIVEVDKNNNVIFGSNLMKFSPFVPGRAQRLDDRTLLIGGMKPEGEEGTPDSDHPFDFRAFFGTDDLKTRQKETLQQILFGGTTPFVGSVIEYDQQSGATTFQYTSPEGMVVSDVDTDPITGERVVAESSLTQSGRIVKLDSIGNITFSLGEGLYTVINDVAVQFDGSLVLST